MASLTGQLVAETYKALLKTIDNDILTASEKQITDGFGGGSNVFIDSQGFLRANKYKVTNGLATQFLKADGSLDSNTYLTGITSSQIISALGYTPVTSARTLTINGTTYDLSENRSWTVAGTAAVWGNISGTLSNQTDLQTALNAKYNNPSGTISQYIRGDGSLATFPTLPGGLPTGGTTGQILAKIDATDYNTHWIDNYATQTKNEVKLGATLSKGTPVYVSSANGTNMIVSAASNTSEATSSKTFGLLETGGALNDQVKCVTFGLLAGLNTSTAQAGDAVWLGPNGTLLYGLANKPVAPAHMVYIGVVTRVQSNNGEIFVNVQNGFEIEELHDVLIQSKANNQGLFYESSTGLWKNKSIATVLGYTPQAELNGTGFVKASGTTISYDNSTYLTTTDAASTYQRLDKMVSNLLASATEYPNSNAVIAALALKANAENPVFTGNMTISGAEPKLYFTDTDQNPDYFIGVDGGFFRIYDQTAGQTRFVINGSGVTTIAGDLIVGSVAKSGGTAAQFLKADGSIDSSTYVTSTSLANYLLITTAASTYQRLDKMVSNLLASSTEYPNSNAVIAALALKADAANPVFTGNLTISGAEPKLYFTDTDQNPDYFIGVDAGYFRIYNQTAGQTKFVINTDGDATFTNSVTASSIIKSGGTSSQYLMADGSVSTLSNPVTGSGTSGYLPRWTSATTLNDSIIFGSGNNIGIGTADPKANLHVNGSTATLRVGPWFSSSDRDFIELQAHGSDTKIISPNERFHIDNSAAGLLVLNGLNNGNVVVGGTTDNGFKFDVIGTGRFTTSVVSSDYRFVNFGYITYNTENVSTNTFTLRNFGTTIFSVNTSNITQFTNYITADGIGSGISAMSAWGSSPVRPIIEGREGNAISNYVGLPEMYYTSNAFYNGTAWVRKSANASINMVLSGYNNNFLVQSAPTGTAGGAVSFSTLLLINGSTGAASFSNSVTAATGFTSTKNIVAGEATPLNLTYTSSDGNGPLMRLGSGTQGWWDVQPSNNNQRLTFEWLDSVNVLNLFSTGNVGINTTTDAGYRLDVNGTGRLIGNGSTSALTITNSTSNPQNYIDFTAGTTVISRLARGNGASGMEVNGLNIDNYSGFKIRINQLGGSGGTFSVDGGASTFSSNVTIGGQLNVNAGVGDIATFKGDGGFDGSNRVYINNNAYIYGRTNLVLTGRLDASNDGYSFGTSCRNSLVFAVNEGGAQGAVGTQYYSFQLQGVTKALYLQSKYGADNALSGFLFTSDNKLLIRTTTDSGYVLDVNGNFRVSSTSIFSSNVGIGSSLGTLPTTLTLKGASIGDGIGKLSVLSGGDENSWTQTRNEVIRIGRGDIPSAYYHSIWSATGGSTDETLHWLRFYISNTGGSAQTLALTLNGYGDANIGRNATASAFFESSDFRLKTLINDNPIIYGIENLEAKLYEKNGKIELGYFAQDAEIFMPYAVTKNVDGFLSLSYREVHTAKIARLEKEVAELKEKLNAA